METIAHPPITSVQAARSELCGLCWAPPGVPCTMRGEPEGDHLTRYAAARQAGTISAETMAAVLDAAEVIARHVIVPAEVMTP
jgi:hypothetical protein